MQLFDLVDRGQEAPQNFERSISLMFLKKIIKKMSQERWRFKLCHGKYL